MVGVVVCALPCLNGVVVDEQTVLEVHALPCYFVSALIGGITGKILTLVGDSNTAIVGEPPILSREVIVACPDLQSYTIRWLCTKSSEVVRGKRGRTYLSQRRGRSWCQQAVPSSGL